jgi:hypothetical protein
MASKTKPLPVDARTLPCRALAKVDNSTEQPTYYRQPIKHYAEEVTRRGERHIRECEKAWHNPEEGTDTDCITCARDVPAHWRIRTRDDNGEPGWLCGQCFETEAIAQGHREMAGWVASFLESVVEPAGYSLAASEIQAGDRIVFPVDCFGDRTLIAVDEVTRVDIDADVRRIQVRGGEWVVRALDACVEATDLPVGLYHVTSEMAR